MRFRILAIPSAHNQILGMWNPGFYPNYRQPGPPTEPPPFMPPSRPTPTPTPWLKQRPGPQMGRGYTHGPYNSRGLCDDLGDAFFDDGSSIDGSVIYSGTIPDLTQLPMGPPDPNQNQYISPLNTLPSTDVWDQVAGQVATSAVQLAKNALGLNRPVYGARPSLNTTPKWLIPAAIGAVVLIAVMGRK